MTGIATIICLALAGLTVLVAGIQALRDRAINYPALVLAGLTEVAVLFYTGVRVADLIGGHHTSNLAIVLAYLFGLVITMPIAVALAWAERTKWGSVTLGAGALIACALFGRINQLWTPHG
jgi:hypothetical protein